MNAPFPADTPFAEVMGETDVVAPRQRPSEIRAADYRQKAAEAAEKATSSPLDNVRQLHEAAAARWLQLAGLEDSRREPAATASLRLAFSKLL